MSDPIRETDVVVRINAPGFSLAMRFDPNDECDCEILAEAYLLVKRRTDNECREQMRLE